MMRKFLAIALFLLTGNAFGATYYVDPDCADTNPASATVDGTEYNPATLSCTGGSASYYVTIADVNLKSFSAGDSVLFKKGSTWQEMLVIPSSGTAASRITFGSYGDAGNRPKILRSWGDSDYAIFISGKSNINVNDIHVSTAVGGITMLDADNVTVNNCLADSNFVFGIGAVAGGTYSNINILNSTSITNAGRGISLDSVTSATVTGNTVSGNNWANDASGYVTYGGGIVTSAVTGLTVEGNSVFSNGIGHTDPWGGHGIWIDLDSSNMTIRYNKVYGNNRHGIFAEANSNGGSYYYNLVYSNGLEGGLNAGITVEGRSGDVSDNVYVYNNVVYGNTVGIRVSSQDNSADSIRRTIVKNNLVAGSSSFALAAYWGGENDGTIGSGNVYEYNGFGPESTNFIYWGTGGISTYSAFNTAYGGTTYSLEADPLFVSPGNNFHLKPNSPAINQGTSVGLTRDYDGFTVPRGAGPDIGAYEWANTPLLISPPTSTVIGLFPIMFEWEGFYGSDLYQLQVDDNSDYSSPEIDVTTADTTYETDADDGIKIGTTYHWRVRARK